MNARAKIPFDPEREAWLNGLIPVAEGAEVQDTATESFRERARRDGELIKISERIYRVRRRYAYGL
jgi:hypothetical protein